MYKSVFVGLSILLFVIIFSRCANQVSPTGGPKDTIAPIIKQTVPIDKSKNYNGSLVDISFDEFIQIENIKQELLITPAIDGDYEYRPTKTGIRLTFTKPFRPNTTYTLNFRRAIKDITEKNVAENVKLVFSTGDELDTLSIAGNIKDLQTDKPSENVLVMLYPTTDTLVITKHKPYYFTKTDKQGKYQLENLKKDVYNIYALDERNNNLKYDQEKEKIGFILTPISMDSNYTNVNIQLSIIDTIAPKIRGNSAKSNYYEIEFNEGVTEVGVTSPNQNQEISYVISQPTKVRIYNTFNNTDSIPLVITAVDSMANTMSKEVKIKFSQDRDKDKKNKIIEKFEMGTLPSDGGKTTEDFDFLIAFNKPIKAFDLAKIEVQADTITSIPIDISKDWTWNKYQTELRLRKKIRVSRNVRVILPKGTFMSIENDSSAAARPIIDIKDPESYGSMLGEVETSEPNFIVQLLNCSDNKVVSEQRNKKSYAFSFLEAGDYRVRVIIDRNNNGKWDQGSFFQNQLPEQIIYGKCTKLKENWEIKYDALKL